LNQLQNQLLQLCFCFLKANFDSFLELDIASPVRYRSGQVLVFGHKNIWLPIETQMANALRVRFWSSKGI
jgi:hypothetical protein